MCVLILERVAWQGELSTQHSESLQLVTKWDSSPSDLV